MSKDINVRPMIEAIQELTKIPTGIIPGFGWGTIKSVKPLILSATNGIEIPESLINLSPFCYEWTTKRLEHLHTYNVEHNHTVEVIEGSSKVEKTTSTEMTEDRETSKEISSFTFWRGLQVGDKVAFLRINDSQRFIILWRENQFDLEE